MYIRIDSILYECCSGGGGDNSDPKSKLMPSVASEVTLLCGAVKNKFVRSGG